MDPPVSVPIESGTWYAATEAADPPLDPPGTRPEVPRVGGRPERGVLGGRAHRELVHVGLAQDHRAGVAEALRDVGVERRPVSLQDPGARPCTGRPATDTRSLSATGIPSSGWSASSARRALGASGGQARVGGIGLRHRPVVVDRQPRVQAAVRGAGAGEVRGRDLARGDVAGPEEARQLVGEQGRRVGRRGRSSPPGHSPPRIAGTTKNVAVALGRVARGRRPAPATAAPHPRAGCSPARSPAPSAGSRRCPARRASAYWSRMWLSWPWSRASSSSVSPRRARWATCSTSERVSEAMAR